MASSTLGRSIIRISARAFAHPTMSGGGNPVTVFLSSSSSLSPPIRCNLAQTCDWESVFAQIPTSSALEQGQRPVLSFYMPSGEEVTFCAHAAIGAAAVIASEQDLVADTSNDTGNDAERLVEFTTTFDENPQRATFSSSGEAELQMTAEHTEDDIPDFIALGKLRDALGLRMEDVSLGGTGLPSYINSSVARNKTLFPMLDVQRLHFASNPPDPDEFRDLCDKIKSTGIYLYSPLGAEATGADNIDSARNDNKEEDEVEVLRYECRQFPRASGYPEDPATGIAAAALAASLRKRGIGAPEKEEDAVGGNSKTYRYEFIQGTAMGRSSKIGVRFDEDIGKEDIQVKDKDRQRELKMYVSGLVEILSRDEEALPE